MDVNGFIRLTGTVHSILFQDLLRWTQCILKWAVIDVRNDLENLTSFRIKRIMIGFKVERIHLFYKTSYKKIETKWLFSIVVLSLLLSTIQNLFQNGIAWQFPSLIICHIDWTNKCYNVCLSFICSKCASRKRSITHKPYECKKVKHRKMIIENDS